MYDNFNIQNILEYHNMIKMHTIKKIKTNIQCYFENNVNIIN